MIKSFNSLLVTMFGLGKIRYMPGTFGSLATVIILYHLFHTLNISPNIILYGLIIIFIYSFYAVSSHIENNENKDPGEIVIDEFLGQSIPIYLYEISHGTTKDSSEAIVSVRGKDKYVVMSFEQYSHLRTCELEAGIHEARADMAAGRYVRESAVDHLNRLDAMK